MTSEEKRKRVNKLKRIIIAFAESYDQIDGSYSEKDMEQILSYIAETRILSEIDHREELDKAREEGRKTVIAELSISENMEEVERFFREAPIDYDDKCNLWNDFLSKLKDKK